MKEFIKYLIFVPSSAPSKVAINVMLKTEEVETWFEKKEMHVIKSVSFEGNELLAGDEDSNVFPFHAEDEVVKDTLKQMLCEGYGIPTDYLDVIFNEDPGRNYMWLNKKFKRSFRAVRE